MTALIPRLVPVETGIPIPDYPPFAKNTPAPADCCTDEDYDRLWGVDWVPNVSILRAGESVLFPGLTRKTAPRTWFRINNRSTLYLGAFISRQQPEGIRLWETIVNRKYLLTAFSPGMLSNDCANYDVQFDRVDPQEARSFIDQNTTIAVFQKSLAEHIRQELQLPFSLPLSRSRIILEPDDEALIATYCGPRFDDQVPLPAGTRLSYWRLSLFSAT